MKQELLIAIEQLEKERGISKEILIDTLVTALQTAYKKNFGSTQNVRVDFSETTGEIKVYSSRLVVEEIMEDETVEILLEDAKQIDPSFELGDTVEEEVTPKDFGRIAAQTARQVVVQRIREAERNIIFDQYSDRASEIINGSVQRIAKGIIYINLGKTEAMLLPSEQIATEKYEQGLRIKTYITEVKNTTKGPQILVSRTHPGLVKRLFELEVPEIHDGEVEIKSIAREAGSRTKLAVYTSIEEVDPVGSCVGPKGARVQNIVAELNGEKIDIIEWSEDPVQLISNALSPSAVERVILSDEEKAALVVVPDNQLSLAIGKEGQNARLAAKLTNWKIDIKSSSQYDAMDISDFSPGMIHAEEAIHEAEEAADDEDVYEDVVENEEE
ncbi:MAG: transcription termination/antitermination protein NusA [Clostridia bacterium]|nr:transcription termination/antitermination protein NusA [Clostridia bacterium]